MIRKEKGITLIALIVAIIVLLILAGITINMLTGKNGILNRASEAKKITGTAQEEELVNLLAMEVTTRTLNSHDNLTQEILDEAIKSQFGKNGAEGEIINDGYNLTVKKTGNIYQIKDGKVSKALHKEDLKKDENPGVLEKIGENTWQINSIEDLVALSYEVNSGANSYDGKTVELGRDLWFTGEFDSYNNENSIYVQDDYGHKPSDEGTLTIKEHMINGKGFFGIGQETGSGNNPYKGSFDGKGYGIYGIKFCSYFSNGLFKKVEATTDMEFKNVTLGKGSNTSIGGQYNGIISKIDGEGSIKVDNIVNETFENGIIIDGSGNGGIIGCISGNVNLNIKNCVNKTSFIADKTSTSRTTGGIIGIAEKNAKINMDGCINKSNMNGGFYCIGGIIGSITNNSEISITNCKNEGDIIECSALGSGGIIGYFEGKNISVSKCENRSEMKGTPGNMGGIIGGTSNGRNDIVFKIKDCINYARLGDSQNLCSYVARNFWKLWRKC